MTANRWRGRIAVGGVLPSGRESAAALRLFRHRRCLHVRSRALAPQPQDHHLPRDGHRADDEHHIADRADRSEEHTSELQSLMRISYAVFCLKKKKTTQNKNKHHKQKQYKTRNTNRDISTAIILHI